MVKEVIVFVSLHAPQLPQTIVITLSIVHVMKFIAKAAAIASRSILFQHISISRKIHKVIDITSFLGMFVIAYKPV